jgi:hypothetical protein
MQIPYIYVSIDSVLAGSEEVFAIESSVYVRSQESGVSMQEAALLASGL